MKTSNNWRLVAALGLAVTLLPIAAQAQQPGTAEKPLPPISLDLRDAPVRQALDEIFRAAKADFSLDNSVQGYVTLKVTDQPFDNVLRLVLRTANPPLTYDNQEGVYRIRPRVDPAAQSQTVAVATDITPDQPTAATSRPHVEKIQIMYADAADIAAIFGGTVINVGAGRTGQNGQGGQNGFAGFGNSIAGAGFGGGFTPFGGGSGASTNGFGNGFNSLTNGTGFNQGGNGFSQGGNGQGLFQGGNPNGIGRAF